MPDREQVSGEAEPCGFCGGSGYYAAEVGPSRATGPCPECNPEPLPVDREQPEGDTTAVLDALRWARNEWERLGWTDAAESLDPAIEAASREQPAGLRTLLPWLRHGQGCAIYSEPWLGRRVEGAPDCDCGLDVALAAALPEGRE